MQKANLEYVLAAAADERQTDPFALAVRGSIEVGVVVPSILRAKLAEAGYVVHSDEAKMSDYGFKTLKVLQRVIIEDVNGIVAMGAADGYDEALLHAALGWFREHPLEGAEVPEGIMTAPESPAPALTN